MFDFIEKHLKTFPRLAIFIVIAIVVVSIPLTISIAHQKQLKQTIAQNENGQFVTLPTATPNQKAGVGAHISSTNCDVSADLAGNDPEEQRFIDLLNQYRQSKGLSTLKSSAILSNMAAWMSNDIATNKYPLRHEPDSLGRTRYQRAADCGMTQSNLNSEVIDEGITDSYDAAASLRDFENEPAHQALLVQPNLVQVGVGRVAAPGALVGSNAWIWTIDMQSYDDGTTAPTVAAPTSAPNPTGANPQNIVINLTPSADQHKINMNVTGLDGAVALNYEASYNAQVNGQLVPRGAVGSQVTLSGASTYSNTITLGNCANDICQYDTVVGEITVTLVVQYPNGQQARATQTVSLSDVNQITPNPTQIQTTPSPTIPVPTGTVIAATITLPGVGTDTAHGENPTPHGIKYGEIQLTNGKGQIVENTDQWTQWQLNPDSVSYTGYVKADPGTYDVKVRVAGTLFKDLGLVTAIENQTTSLPVTALISGDVNVDNVLDIKDYNLIISRYGSNYGDSTDAGDLNLDGKVDELDLNIFYTGLANRQGD